MSIKRVHYPQQLPLFCTPYPVSIFPEYQIPTVKRDRLQFPQSSRYRKDFHPLPFGKITKNPAISAFPPPDGRSPRSAPRKPFRNPLIPSGPVYMMGRGAEHMHGGQHFKQRGIHEFYPDIFSLQIPVSISCLLSQSLSANNHNLLWPASEQRKVSHPSHMPFRCPDYNTDCGQHGCSEHDFKKKERKHLFYPASLQHASADGFQRQRQGK